MSGVGSIPTRSRQLSRPASALRHSLALWALYLIASGASPVARAQDLPSPVAPDTAETRPDAIRAAPGPDSGRVVTLPPEIQGGTLVAPGQPSSGGASSGWAWHREPKWIMLRSVVVPGWGQWSNGKHLKAIVVAAGEGYLIGRAIDYGRKERRAERKAREAADDPALEAGFEEERRYLASRRRDFTWWSAFAAVLSMGDAYVDAQLGPFDAEFEPQDGNAARPAGIRAGLRLRF